MINAAAGCEKFWKEKSRIVAISGTKNSTYLSCMKNEERNAPEAIRILFRTGEYDNVMHKKPSAKRFEEITYGRIVFKHDEDELLFRETIRDALLNGDNSHMTDKEISDLLESSKNDDIATFIFKSIYTAIMCNGNTAKRKIYKTDLKEMENETIRTVNSFTETEKAALRILDDNS